MKPHPLIFISTSLLLTAISKSATVYGIRLETDNANPAYTLAPVTDGATITLTNGGALASGNPSSAAYTFVDTANMINFGFTLQLGGTNPGLGADTSGGVTTRASGFGVSGASFDAGENVVAQIINESTNIQSVVIDFVRLTQTSEGQSNLNIDTNNDGTFDTSTSSLDTSWTGASDVVVFNNPGGATDNAYRILQIGYTVTLVPEPSGICLLSIAGMGMLLKRRR